MFIAGCAAIPPAAVAPSPAQRNQVLVLDIDGTLTPHNLYVLEVRPAAPQVVQAYADKGYTIVYLTTRLPLYQSMLPDWLARQGFPAGPLHAAQSAAEREDAATFKAGVLARYRAAGWQLAYAYGDSASDFEAYSRAGLPPERVFALKRRFAETCTAGLYRSCLEGWVEHLPFVEREVAKLQ
ncbi:LNS2 (Lipin/Ned1/Smp2) [Burkholderiales bacterium JOSHI_001]|nr:LNS2 (Lipin/Ned1/Smp2) [Burkholderiales bacterium JOSHI_001]